MCATNRQCCNLKPKPKHGRAGGSIRCIFFYSVYGANSEEVFDFSAENMTSEKAIRLKRQMNAELKLIFQVCIAILVW